MLENLFTYPVIGIEADSDKIKVARVALTKGKVHIQQISSIAIDPSSDIEPIAKPLYVSEGQTLQEAFSQTFSSSVVPASDILIRSLEIKLTKEREVKAAVPFQVEPLLPFPIENTSLDYIIVKKTSNSSLVNVLALRKDLLEHHLNHLNSLQLNPEGISCTQVALASFADYYCHTNFSGRPSAIIHIGQKETVCVIVGEGSLLASHAISIGVSTLAKALAKDKEISNQQSQNLLTSLNLSLVSSESEPHLYSVLDSLYLEIAKSLFALTKQCKAQHISEILLTGEGSLLQHLALILAQKVNAVISAPKQTGEQSPQQLQEYAVPIGLALSFLNKKNPINFRKDNFSYPDPWKRLKTPLIAYYSLCCFVAFALYFFGSTWSGFQQDKIKEGYVELLSTMDKPYKAFEKELLSKQTHGEISDDEILPLSALNQEELLIRLETLQKEIQNTPDIFPLNPNVPKVSDVLAWLSTHPNVVIGKTGSHDPKAVLKIENLTYTMIKRPEQSKKQDKYQVRVELEFTSETPKLAREFHDALIAPNDMVAPKEEIKWNTAPNNRYRTSFILKDKTTYMSG